MSTPREPSPPTSAVTRIRKTRRSLYVIIAVVIVVIVVLGVGIAVLSAPSSPASTADILPPGTVFHVPAAGHSVVGPVDLTSHSYWRVNYSFSSSQGIDFVELNLTQYQAWNLDPGQLPTHETQFLGTVPGGDAYSYVFPGTYYYLWWNTNQTSPATITIYDFTAVAVPPPSY